MDILPAATGGVLFTRWGMKLAGDLEIQEVTQPSATEGGPSIKVKVPVVGMKHAIAGIIAANLSAGLVESVFHDAAKGRYAQIAGLGFVGDIFARQRLLSGSKWVQENLLLQGVDCEDVYVDQDDLSGLQTTSALGELYQDGNGNVYRLAEDTGMAGLQTTSSLGSPMSRGGRPNSGGGRSTFGYSRR